MRVAQCYHSPTTVVTLSIILFLFLILILILVLVLVGGGGKGLLRGKQALGVKPGSRLTQLSLKYSPR